MTDSNWKPLRELQDPFNDAENYRTRPQKDFFNQLFLRTEDLYKCLDPATYYLLGEKGSGKTAYATYLENNTINDTQCKLSTMTESQYKRFIALKRQGKLEYSDYANIWRPILLTMMSQVLVQRCKSFLGNITGKFSAIEKLISEFNADALNPEVEVAFRIVSESKDKVSIGSENVGSFGVEESFQRTDEIEVIRHHLLQKESELKKAIGELRVGKNVALFMDGIDFRPESVPYIDYIECIKGLGEAAWHLNSDFFGNIRDSKGRLKIVLLLRPDVFHSMNIYNSNSRLRDNSVLLDWSTTEKEMRVSKLYSAAGRYFASQQGRHVDSVNPVEAADNYFSSQHDNTIFRRFLRTSFQKPRDVLTFIQTARQVSVLKLNKGDDSRLAPEVVTHPLFTKDYAVYLLGEVKNYAAFYMEQSDFATYLKFFQYLDGRSEFTYSQFCEAFRRFKKWINGEPLKATTYLRDAEALLQFFYDVNVIGYSEAMEDQKSDTRSPKATFYHWAYRERTLIDIAPKVKMSGLLRVNPGISKALDIGLHAQHPGSKEPERTRKARFARPGHRKANKQTDKRSGTAPSLQIQGGSKTDHKVALTNRDDGRKPYQDDRAATTTARQQQRHRQSNANGTKTQDSGRAPSSLGARARFKK